MSPVTARKQSLKETLARLRAAQRTTVDAAVAAHKKRMGDRRKIRDELTKGPATVPSVAAACGLKASEVLWHVAAMRKYGALVEQAQVGDYITYRLAQDDSHHD